MGEAGGVPLFLQLGQGGPGRDQLLHLFQIPLGGGQLAAEGVDGGLELLPVRFIGGAVGREGGQRLLQFSDITL